MDIFAQLRAEGAMIERLTSDSRSCSPGTVFFAYPGERSDGRQHIADAVARGASAVLWEAEGFAWSGAPGVPNRGVTGLKAMAGRLANAFYSRPSEALWVCGVTGTNGKTSCSQWIASALDSGGVRAGVIGTLGSGFPGALDPVSNTTPDALELHRMLARMRDSGAAAAAIEVSSHGIVQQRVAGVAFDCALLTNLSHDHLDYHGSMEAYAAAKAQLFEAPGLGAAVLNLDDVLGVQLVRRLAGSRVRTIGYALSPGSIVPGAADEYIVAQAFTPTLRGMAIEIASSFGEGSVQLSQLGRFNVANVLGVLGCLLAYGIDFQTALERLGRLPPVLGRMQVIGGSGDPLVVVDYAHTPDALEKVLQALRPIARARGGQLVAVFGAGGDRDPTKRPAMGAVAAQHADRVLVTSDNPRSERPLAIIEDILKGMAGASPADVEPERARAVELAIRASQAVDVVLLAGKGHEPYQEVDGVRRPYSDIETASIALRARRDEQVGGARSGE